VGELVLLLYTRATESLTNWVWLAWVDQNVEGPAGF